MNALGSAADAIGSIVANYLQRFPSEALSLRELVLQLQADEHSILSRSNTRGHITASCLVLNQTRTRVLLVRHVALQCWLPPGGHFELPGTLEESALREVTEETGARALPLDWSRGPVGLMPIDIDTHPIPPNPKKGEAGHLHHDFMFVAIADEGKPLVPQLAEVHEVRWWDAGPLVASGDRRLARVLGKCLRLRVLAQDGKR